MLIVGVSVPVPEPWGSAIRDARLGYGDTAAHAVPTHVTLFPPTLVPRLQMDEVEEHLSEVAQAHEPFRMRLRGTGSFRPLSQVVFIQVAEGVSSCERLESAVRRGPLVRELHFPYHPHVTVAHDVGEEQLERAFQELSSFSADFVVDAFDLYVNSDDDGVWRSVRSFPLGQAADDPLVTPAL